jgi:predicted ATP-binding protein involved in virulence
MRVTKIQVKRLFGIFDHEIVLKTEERVTIIHGPNGYGKTVMLKMVVSLLKGDTLIFEHTPFAEFSLGFDDTSEFTVRRREEAKQESSSSRVVLEYEIRDSQGTISAFSPKRPDIPRAVLARVDQLVPGLRLVGDAWVDVTGRRYSLSEVLRKFPRAVAAVPPDYRRGLVIEPLAKLDVFFVEANRLAAETSITGPAGSRKYLYATSDEMLLEEPQVLQPRVKQYSDDVVQRIQSVLADYAKHSQERDRTFPERFVRFVRRGEEALAEKEILSRMKELEEKRTRLVSLGLLDSEKGLTGLNEEDVARVRDALTIYVEDVGAKLKVFDDIAGRIGTLADIVNDRFKYKKLKMDRQHGFLIVTDLGQRVQLENLSSGEQHELVVLYELLFRSPKNALVLIDEPEISLHVAWQSRFLADLIDILKLTEAYAIVATHSPVVVGTRWDLTIELRGPGEEETRHSHA